MLPLQGAWVQSLVQELRSHKLRGTAKKKKKIQRWGLRVEVVRVRIWFKGQADRTADGLDVGSGRKRKRRQDVSEVSALRNRKDRAAIIPHYLSLLTPST